MNLAQGLLRTATAALLLLTGTALAQTRVTVPTLRSTGAGITYAFNDGLRIRPDPNYTVVLPNESAQVSSTFHGFISALAPATGPIPPWLGDSSTSLWIGPSGGGLGVIAGTYTYKTSSLLTGFEPGSIAINGRMAADNRVTAFRINGVATAITGLASSGFSEWTPFQFAAGTLTNLLPSINTIEVDVLNTGQLPSPAGFRMEIEGTGVPILLDRSVIGFWNFQSNSPLPVVAAADSPLSFSTDAPPGTETSLRVGPTKLYAKVMDPTRTLLPGRDSTLAAWIKPLAGAASTAGEVIFSYGGGGGYKLWLANGRRIAFTVYGVRDVTSDIVFPNDGQWHHIAAVHQAGSGIVFYLDGVPRDFKAYTEGHRAPAETQLLIGYEGSFTQPFNGLIDDVLIASSALSPAQFMPTPNPSLVSVRTPRPDVTLFRNDSSGGIRNATQAGDVDGDGYDDVLILRQNPNTAFLVFGSSNAPVANLDLRSIDSPDFIRIFPPAGSALADRMSSGDINGDGLSDILVRADNLSGSGLYVLYGRSRSEWRAAGPSGRYELGNLTGPSPGRAGDARLSGATATTISQDFTTVGDVDGDGFDEVLFSTSARVYLLYGGPAWPSGDTLLMEHPLQREIFSEGSSMATLSAAGDVNGDGFNDMLIANPQLNRVWLIFGVPRGNDSFFPGAPFNRTSILGLNAANRRNGVGYIDTIRTVEGLGMLMAAVGDTNGDGLDSSEQRYVNFAPTLHAFQGLAATPDLLAEELALLRGRDDSTEPSITRPPVYNRLRWNTAGELGRVAYMANYDIRDAQGRIDGNIDAADAQFYYPQGHGDAWGHYLSSLKYYYRLAINPLFTWIPRTELDEVNGVDVSVDFAEEQKFIRGAAAKARTGAEIVNLTYRDRFTENPEGQWQGYKDQNRARAWGVADWATRAGQGAYFDWMLGNALLPEAGPRVPIAGVRPIDRGTQPDFNEITAAYERIQTEVDNADRGLNPLGLERGVMPFDISLAAADGEQTHFEQIYERAVMSLSTAITTFYYANGNTQRLRQQADDLATFQSEVRAQEFDFQSRLIEVFGQPYREDIGPGGIYPAGYTGPDYLHYDYIDPSALLGLVRDPANLALRQKSVSIQYTENPFTFAANGSLDVGIGTDGLIRTTSTTVPYTVTDAFGITKPTAFTDRLSTGELQQTRSALLQSVGTYLTRLTEYNNLIAEIDDRAALLEARFNIEADRIQVIKDRNSEVQGLNISIATIRFTAQILNAVGKDINEAVEAGTDGLPKAVGTSVDPSFGARLVAKLLGKVASGIYVGLANVAEGSALSMEAARDGVELRTELRLAQLEGSLALREAITELQTLIRNETALRYDLMTQLEGIQQQTSAYQSAITRGFRLLQEFKRFRFETSAAVAKARHKDMAYRVFRNDALQKYRAQFDLAARYTYLAARAYDFETAFLPGDRRGAGSDFLNRIIRSRVIGNMQDNDGDGVWNPYVGGLGDAGLADAMARMNENWTLNLKSQLGFNNTQPDITSFSLRYDLFQLLPHDTAAPDATSDATWRAVLSSPDVRRANLLTLEAFNRYCIPFSPRDEVNGEPALVIPFSTTVNAGENFFGNPLVEDQQQFDSTKFATKIRSVKIAFQGLSSVGLAAQPLVYLIPTGADVLRSPSDPRNIATRQWYILDQAIPVPFPLNFQSGGVIPSALSNPGWIPAINGLSGSQGALRRHGSLRAFDTESSADGISSTRLVGRSVWNTRWLLIIPGRTLFSDPAEGIERFINGRIDPTTGTRSGNGVKDIQIEFETYAIPGS